VIACRSRRGPAVARNVGARAARGGILLFIDSDVLVPPDALARIQARFAEEPGRAAVIGSYDAEPGAPISSPKSQPLALLHYTRAARPGRALSGPAAAPFDRDLPGAGRVLGGLHRTFGGGHGIGCLRMRQQGRRDLAGQGSLRQASQELSFGNIVRTDVLDRAVPWTMLILRFRSMRADLNLRWEQRASVLLAGAAAGAMEHWPVAAAALPGGRTLAGRVERTGAGFAGVSEPSPFRSARNL